MGIEKILQKVDKKLKESGCVVIGPLKEKKKAIEFKDIIKEYVNKSRYVIGIGLYNGKEKEYYVSICLKKEILKIK